MKSNLTIYTDISIYTDIYEIIQRKMQVLKHNVEYSPIRESVNVYVDMHIYSCRRMGVMGETA